MSQFLPRSIETLIDLVEIKLSCLDVLDREDREELKALQRSLAELQEYRRTELPGDAGLPATGRTSRHWPDPRRSGRTPAGSANRIAGTGNR